MEINLEKWNREKEKKMTCYRDHEFLEGEGLFSICHEWEEKEQKERRKIWRSKGKTIAEIMKLFYTVRENTVKLNEKVKDIRFFHRKIEDSSISFLERSFSFVEEHIGYLEKDKNPNAFKEFRNSLTDLLDSISVANQFVSTIHIPPLPPTYYSFKDFLAFFSMLTERSVEKEDGFGGPKRAFRQHADYFYNRYMKKEDEEGADEKENPSPTQFSREEITVLHHYAVEAKEFFWRDGVDYFPTCLPEDIREFSAALSLLGEVWSEDRGVRGIVDSLDRLNVDLHRFRKEFRNFIKHTIPIPFTRDIKVDDECDIDERDF